MGQTQVISIYIVLLKTTMGSMNVRFQLYDEVMRGWNPIFGWSSTLYQACAANHVRYYIDNNQKRPQFGPSASGPRSSQVLQLKPKKHARSERNNCRTNQQFQPIAMCRHFDTFWDFGTPTLIHLCWKAHGAQMILSSRSVVSNGTASSIPIIPAVLLLPGRSPKFHTYLNTRLQGWSLSSIEI